MKIGEFENLTKTERRAIRARVRLQKKIAAGVPMCGAKTRAGTPCRASKLYRGGRCKLHGGWSTGAKTPEGLARRDEALLRAREARARARAERLAAASRGD